jgi:hypothetical protein
MIVMLFNLRRLKLILSFIALTLVTSLGFQNCGKFSAVGADGEFGLISSASVSGAAGALTPAVVTISPNQTLQFSQSNDDKSGKFQMIAGYGSIDSRSGVYTPTMDLTDAIVGRRDSLGNWSYAYVKVAAADGPVALIPSAILLAPGGKLTLNAAGGTPPYVYAMNLGSASIIDAVTGELTASNNEETATITAVDAFGKTAQSSVEIKRSVKTMRVLNTPNPILSGRSAVFVVNGGTSPYSLELVSGNGSVSGQVYMPGTFTGTASFRFTDSRGQVIHMSVPVR